MMKKACSLSYRFLFARVRWWCLRALRALGVGTVCLLLALDVAQGEAGTVVGRIDSLRLVGGQYQLSGWACQQGVHESIDIQIFVDHSAFVRPPGTFVLKGIADLPNEPAVDRMCGDRGGRHRFAIDIPNQILDAYRGRPLFAHGIRKQGTVTNAVLASAGTVLFPAPPPPSRTVPETFPPLAGKYASGAQHPRVFITQADLSDVAARINRPGSFSARRFARLVERVEADLAANIDWDATYSGCDIDIYLHGFSIEPRGGYASETRPEEQLDTAMGVRPGAQAPAGAAVVASRLALYAALAKAGAAMPPGAPAPDQVVALAKRILLAWTAHGFRDGAGKIRQAETQFCDGSGRQVPPQTLQIARGIVYSVQAQDLLQGLHGLNPDEVSVLNSFHGAMYDWIRSSSNAEFDRGMRWKYPDETYNNQFANHLLALLALARLFDDRQRFTAALYGTDPSLPVRLPWLKLFNYVIYGVGDAPLLRVTPNSSDDPLKSSPAYSTTVVAPGEINDRYRNLTPLQGMGYPVFTLEHLFAMAEIMRNTGYDSYGYRGFRDQSIEMAAQYYACYAKSPGFYKVVSAENAAACPDHQQYVGKVVNDVETVVLLGAYRFPGDAAITGLEATARDEAAKGSIDAIRFGKWRD